jgi:transcriptional regulator with XRE-family HTH domain
MMEESDKKLDMKELGRRFKLIRQHLGLTQTEVANQLGTSQLMIYRTEKGESILSPLLLSTILFYSKSVSLEALFSKNFDIEDEKVFDKNYALNSIVKAKLDVLRDDILTKLQDVEVAFKNNLDSAIDLL